MTKKKYTPGPTIKGDFDKVGLVNALTEAKVKLAKVKILAQRIDTNPMHEDMRKLVGQILELAK